MAEERSAVSSVARGRNRLHSSSSGVAPSRGRPTGTLTAITDDEYRYVVSDLRKIAVVFAGIFAVLLLSWLVIVVGGIGNF